MPQDDWLIIGKIVSTQGLKGELRVLSYSDFPERFEQAGKRWICPTETAPRQAVELINGRCLPNKSGLYIVRLAGIDTCDQAEALRNYLFVVPSSDRPTLEPDEYHVSDLIDCDVIHQPTGKLLGKVIGIMTAGNDLLEVQNQDDRQVVLIPFVKAIAPIVDLDRKCIEITPPNGLVDHWL
ncbi:ribosome maturation factor RimM [Tumidithrix elongata RA019]|uniref:Ribosome maturation factor RimM n=1 Tax=Tumidithrix elongata BACA0141 TaxID=2716417 RepID=A0AAW9Q077_9CYAN|nr:ribosome maturation factor RimM [Tumidithrix elongata RA019]